MEITPYQAELKRLLRLSTLTPGTLHPSDTIRTGNHAAVFINNEPFILCGPSNDLASIVQAQALAASPEIKNAFRALGKVGEIRSGAIAGKEISWKTAESAVVAKESGRVEHGKDTGPLVAIVLNDPHQALTAYLCVNTKMARILDAKAPELDDGHRLPSLARGNQVGSNRHSSQARSNHPGLTPKPIRARKAAQDVGMER